MSERSVVDGLNQFVWSPLALLIYLKRTMVEKRLDHVRPATLVAAGAFVASCPDSGTLMKAGHPDPSRGEACYR